MSSLLKWIGALSLILFVAMQFVQPERTNPRINDSLTIQAVTKMPPDLLRILTHSCADCHTHSTEWRWYSQVAPFSWLQIADVGMGREHVNFSQWGNYTKEQQEHRLKEVCENVRSGDMPLWYYKPLHPEAALSADDVKQICEWTEGERQRLGVK